MSQSSLVIRDDEWDPKSLRSAPARAAVVARLCPADRYTAEKGGPLPGRADGDRPGSQQGHPGRVGVGQSGVSPAAGGDGGGGPSEGPRHRAPATGGRLTRCRSGSAKKIRPDRSRGAISDVVDAASGFERARSTATGVGDLKATDGARWWPSGRPMGESRRAKSAGRAAVSGRRFLGDASVGAERCDTADAGDDAPCLRESVSVDPRRVVMTSVSVNGHGNYVTLGHGGAERSDPWSLQCWETLEDQVDHLILLPERALTMDSRWLQADLAEILAQSSTSTQVGHHHLKDRPQQQQQPQQQQLPVQSSERRKSLDLGRKTPSKCSPKLR